MMRVSPDVDVIVNLKHLETIKLAMASDNFIHAEMSGRHVFLDGPDGKPKCGVNLIPEAEATAWLFETDTAPQFKVVDLFALVRMNLIQNRDLNGVYIVDLMTTGLIGDSWLQYLESPLCERLESYLNDDNEWYGFNTDNRRRASAPAPRNRCG